MEIQHEVNKFTLKFEDEAGVGFEKLEVQVEINRLNKATMLTSVSQECSRNEL